MDDLEFLNEAFSNLKCDEKILGRDNEQQQIKEFVESKLNKDNEEAHAQDPCVCLMYGQPGTGKTLTVTNMFTGDNGSHFDEIEYRYVNCMELNQTSAAACVLSLMGCLAGNQALHEHITSNLKAKTFTMKALDAAFTGVYSSCFNGKPLVVMDEADVLNKITIKIGKKKVSLLEYLISFAQRKSVLSIYIGNALDLIEKLPKTMKHKILKLPFTLYDSDTLVKIAEQKLDLLKQRMDENTKPNLNPKLVELAVRKSTAKMGGDCRQVFSTVKSMIAAECKEQGSARNALLGSFSSRGEVIRATLESLPLHTQITMVAIVKEVQKESSEANITFYSIYFSYKSICLKFHIKCLPEESIKRSLDVLMATGMISSSTDSKNSSSKRARTTFRSPGRLAATIGDYKTYTTEVTKEVLDYVTENGANILQRLVLLCKSR